MRELREHFVVLASFSLLTVLLTFPIAFQFSTHLPGDGGDSNIFVWNLWWIGVTPDRQGEGGGVALLHRAEADARAAGARLLVVETSALEPLARTREFYRRQGYQQCGTVPDFYAPGDGKVIFAKSLVAVR